jgi:hypothetical protein
MVRHSFVVSIGEVATTCADTVPEPSLTNQNVRASPAESTAESSSRSLNVTVAVGDDADAMAPADGGALDPEVPGRRR